MIVGRALTVNALVSVSRPPSRLTIVTLRPPIAASGSTVMLTLRCVELVRLTELTVMPPPEKRTAEAGHDPARKLEPVMTMVWPAAPWPRELGLRNQMFGAAVMPRQLVQLALAGPGIVTVTFRSEVAALLDTEMSAIKCEGSVKLVELTVTPPSEIVTAAHR